MKRSILVLLNLIWVQIALAGGIITADDPVADEYIVVLHNDLFAPPELALSAERRRDVAHIADDISFDRGVLRGSVFSEALTGFSVHASRKKADELSRDPRVSHVVENHWIDATALVTQVGPPSWGLDRIDQRDPVLDGFYSWNVPQSLSDVHVYVIDSGIRDTHADFGGRVDTIESFDAIGDGEGTDDCYGHGTHVAGTIAGTEHGVAKNAWLHPVRVLDCSGRGSLSTVLSGIDWVTRQVLDDPRPAVANLSLGTSGSSLLDSAVRASIAAGVVYVAAAGNSGDDACQYSPGRIDEVITVGAVDGDDRLASFSSHGECVDIYAPGTGITSTFLGDDFDTLQMSGTSMAAPHLAGIAANLLAQTPSASPQEVMNKIIAQAWNFEISPEDEEVGKLAFSLIDPEWEEVIFADDME